MIQRQTTDTRAASPESLLSIETAAVSDRGLSEKRPVNEDSFLADAERHIFAVADGVGGAESGEVASQTAVETLDEAFRNHKPGDDAEDLMEIAFQRANVAIHQMSREHHKLAMMATTIVALHLDGTRATFGHVGDSRLYHLTADGELRRETADHSVVEEEVRAGRMTQDEAQHHPSRNVISRALGAEANVEAEMRSAEIEAGTLFLLCSDGITRHVSDEELRELLTTELNLHRVCEELKRRCYERGAEDNLTAVIVRVSEKKAQRAYETTRLDEPTVTAHIRPAAAFTTGELPQAFANFDATHHDNEAATQTGATVAADPDSSSSSTRTVDSSSTRIEVSTVGATDETDGKTTHEIPRAAAQTKTISAPRSRTRSRSLLFSAVVAVALITGALAFYFYKAGTFTQLTESAVEPLAGSGVNTTAPAPSPDIAPADASPTLIPTYVEQREAVDEAPQIMMEQMWRERNGAPLDHTDPKFLYLYGRAQFQMGNDREAQTAFRRAVEMMRQQEGRGGAGATERERLSAVEAQLGTADTSSLRRASEMLDQVIERASADAAVQPPPTN